MKLREYQSIEIEQALKWLQKAPLGARRMASAPTGTGKGVIEIALLRLLNAGGVRTALLTPSVEIIKGLMRHFPDRTPGEVEIYTPIKFINTKPTNYECLLIDEGHEFIAENMIPLRLENLLPGAKWLAYTATPYRGTYSGTFKLREYWGDPIEIINLREAASRGYYALPDFDVIPLIDDDGLPTQGEEFVVKDMNEYCLQYDRMNQLAQLIERLYFSGARIVVSVASRMMGETLKNSLSCPSEYIGQDTKRSKRDNIYAKSESERLPIIQLGVLYRGVDLPWLDTLVDAQPTLSSTRWMQTIGRITRPYENRKKLVVCTNRNFERHSWLLAGEIPKAKILELNGTFEQPGDKSYRDLSRWLGFEKTRKHWVIEGADGTPYLWYRFTVKSDGYEIHHLGLLVQPSNRTCVWGTRTMTASDNGWKYSPWTVCTPPTDTRGMRSAEDKPPTPGQIKLWERMQKSAGVLGSPISSEQVTALGFVCDIRRKRNS